MAITPNKKSSTARKLGFSTWQLGCVLAMIVTYDNGKDIFWTSIHGVFSWLYLFWVAFGGA